MVKMRCSKIKKCTYCIFHAKDICAATEKAYYSMWTKLQKNVLFLKIIWNTNHCVHHTLYIGLNNNDIFCGIKLHAVTVLYTYKKTSDSHTVQDYLLKIKFSDNFFLIFFEYVGSMYRNKNIMKNCSHFQRRSPVLFEARL